MRKRASVPTYINYVPYILTYWNISLHITFCHGLKDTVTSYIKPLSSSESPFFSSSLISYQSSIYTNMCRYWVSLFITAYHCYAADKIHLLGYISQYVRLYCTHCGFRAYFKISMIQFFLAARQPYKSPCLPQEKWGQKNVQTFQPSYEKKSCSECHQDVRKSVCPYVRMSKCQNVIFQHSYQNKSCSERHQDVKKSVCEQVSK